MITRGRPTLTRVVVVLVLGCAMLVAGCSSPRQATGLAGSQRTPNIVFVLTDDLSMNLLPFMPHVQALAQQGTSFSKYFVVDSLCCPSRSAIFTGQYPHNNGVFTNAGTDGGYSAYTRNGDSSKTFALGLQRAGYTTAFMGKYLNGYQPQDAPAPDWDEWDAAGDGYSEYDYQLNQDGIQVSYGHDPDDYLTDVLSQRAGHFIDASAGHTSPFALEVSTFAPHRPATPAPRDIGSFQTARAPHGPSWDTLPTDAPPWLRNFPALSTRDQRRINRSYRNRIESVQAVDDLVSHLERRLRADHLLNDTYFVFSSDNGFHTGEHRMLPGKQTAFDTDIQVPLIVSGPGVPKARTVDALGSEVDLAPTFEQIGHATSPDRTDGRSLLPLWHGESPPDDWQQAVLVEHHGPDLAPADPDVQPFRAGNPPSYEAIRTDDATYVEYRNGQREYYDLTSDPYELHNLAGTASPALLGALHGTLHSLETCRGEQQCRAAAAS